MDRDFTKDDYDFVLSEDDERGVKVVGWMLPDGRIHGQTRQYIPDSFFDRVKAARDFQGSLIGNTQKHYRHVAEIPQTLLDEVTKDGNGNKMALNDPDRDKAIKRLLNDGDFSRFRVAGGSV